MTFDFLQRINELCAAKNLTYYELAKRAELTPNAIYNWRTYRSIPKVDALEKIAIAFGLTFESFVCGHSNEISSEEKEMLSKWALLSEEEKDSIVVVIDTFQILKERSQK